MQLRFKESKDLVFIDKPSGFSTHSPDLGKRGACEIYEKQLGSRLYVAHRLDKTTTGCLALARTPQAATELTELFQSRDVKKKYLFLTANRSVDHELECQQDIEGKPASTRFRRVKRSPFFELWEAWPLTGRAHQIRIHASHIGLPILGDPTYGGANFPHLCLHAAELSIPGYDVCSSPPPVFMERLGLLKDRVLVSWLSEMDRRQRLFGFLQNRHQCLRLVHLPQLRIDQFGDQLWIYWYFDKDPSEDDLQRFEFLGGLLKKEWCLRKMQNRGEDPHKRLMWTSPGWQESWLAEERDLKFQLQSDQGQSPGLFLDQRGNREKLLGLSRGRSVLNLFAYTCGFSVAAALGGASKVTSVDVSRPFLDWGRRNMDLNGISPEGHEFFQQDSFLFLKGALKRQRQFDLIVCDPPSFGRHKNGVFRLEQDLEDLLKACWDVLQTQGCLLLSCNLEKWTLQEFKSRIQKVLNPRHIDDGVSGWDFEAPNQEPLMKSVWVKK
jgi:23S rRNA (cytosine1962-C5)-methyltransferase